MRNIQGLVGVVGNGVVQALTLRKMRGTGNVSRLILGLLLSRASILGGLAPFGTAYLAAQSGPGSLFAMLGVMLGYLTLGFDRGLRYMAVSILTYSASAVFGGLKISEKSYFMPLTALAVSGATGAIYCAAQSAGALEMLLLGTELLIIAGASYLFRLALSSDGSEYTIKGGAGKLMLVSCVLLTLSGFEFATLAPARMAAVCIIMLVSFRAGTGMGTCVGMCMGLVMDLGLGVPFYSMSYGSSGMVSGLFKKAGKLWTALAFVGTGAIAALWAPDSAIRLSVMLEFFIASVIFMLIPDSAFSKLTSNAVMEERTDNSERSYHAARSREYAGQRLKETATAFTALHAELKDSIARAEEFKREGIEVVFDRTSKQVCQRCLTVSRCWDYEQNVTYAALREAATLSEKRGWVERADFPPHFSMRCVHFKRFVDIANKEMTSMLYRRQYGARIAENRGQLCRQYAEFGRLLEETSGELELRFDANAERKLSRYLAQRQISAKTEVFELPGGRMCARIEGENLSILMTDKKAFTRDVSLLLGWMANEPDAQSVASLERLTLWETEPMAVTLGIAAHKRDGQSVSGDSGTYFKRDDGKLFIILSDGMGSGAEAAYDSRQAVSLLEKMLKAGVSPETALCTLNSAMCVKSCDSSLFVTIDLLCLNLLTGQLASYKLGAAPTYIYQGGHIRKLGGSAMPAGIEHTQSPNAAKAQLDGEDWVILVTDGITDSENDNWLTRIINKLGESDTPREIAARVLGEAMRTGGASDDMTVLALKTSLVRTR